MENKLKEIREARGYSQAKLAELAGTSQQQIGKLEKGERKLSPEWQIRLSKALNCRPVDLMPEEFQSTITLTKKEEAFLEMFRNLSEREQDGIMAAFNVLTQPVKKDEAG